MPLPCSDDSVKCELDGGALSNGIQFECPLPASGTPLNSTCNWQDLGSKLPGCALEPLRRNFEVGAKFKQLLVEGMHAWPKWKAGRSSISCRTRTDGC
jgi:hypothetical protein